MNTSPNRDRDEDRGYERQRQAKLDAPLSRQQRTGGSIDAAIAAVLEGEVAK